MIRSVPWVALLVWAACGSELEEAPPPSAQAPLTEQSELAACLSGHQVPNGSGLPLPSQTAADEYQSALYKFLRNYEYRAAGWVHDARVRDTGDYQDQAFNEHSYNGTHPAVVIYYSPDAYCWLLTGKKGPMPDGAMFIKEMYPPPAHRYAKTEDVTSLDTPWWTVMVKDKAGARDGWYWGALFDELDDEGARTTLQALDSRREDHYPESGFGSYCVRCHASAEREMTFASLENIERALDYRTGEVRDFGAPIRWYDDESWKRPSQETAPAPGDAEETTNERHVDGLFVEFFDEPQPSADIERMVPAHQDRAVQTPKNSQYVTSDQCMSCHFGDASAFANVGAQETSFANMLVKGEGAGDAGYDISPYGEWRWSMMGLAGRDPIFFAQLESEMEFLKDAEGTFTAERVADKCLSCHGAMGQRQHAIDHPGELFSLDEVNQKTRFGALAREGVSCTVCHQMKDNSHKPIEAIYTGNFEVEAPRDGQNVIYGPFENVVATPMQAALGMTVKKSDFLTSSRLCASCHTVHLPELDKNGNVGHEGFEQATYLEWVNSAYYQGEDAASCQDCHMTGRFAGKKIKGVKIARIQDSEFPVGEDSHGERLQAHGMLPMGDIEVLRRKEYRRHTLEGINVFALMLFKQFPDVLGVPLKNYMNGLDNGIDNAIANGIHTAENYTAKVALSKPEVSETGVAFDVTVTNYAGHRFPTGVGFRRAFLEVTVLDSGRVVWRSGGTNALGAIVDGQTGTVLPSEFNDPSRYSWSHEEIDYQPHHEQIRAQDQVQIYEELVKDEDGAFTTSFLRIHSHFKDNRLLPKGWIANPGEREGIRPELFAATAARGAAEDDPAYLGGGGSDVVRYDIPLAEDLLAKPLRITAKLYYQSIPPRYLRDRFRTQGPMTQRLFYLLSRVNLGDSALAGWKLLVGQAEAEILAGE